MSADAITSTIVKKIEWTRLIAMFTGLGLFLVV